MRTSRIMLGIAAAAALVGTALPAQAATRAEPSCTVGVSLPSKLVITSWNSVVTARLNDPTACAEYASWGLVKGSASASSSGTFSSPTTVDHVDFYTGPSGNRPGTYKAVPRTAYSDDTYLNSDGYEEAVDVLQTDSAPMVAKYASKLSWTGAKRSGSSVTLKATAKRWTPTAGFGGYVLWKDAKVLVQKKVGSAWRTVRTVRTSSKGVATARISSAKKTWRLVTADSSTVWGKTTSSKSR